ncbi:hypothetical protein GCM10009563_00090 [Subtercola frigoramans]
MAQSVIPTVTHATLPDLNADWFLKAYAVAFALAIFAAVIILIPQTLRTARGKQAGSELLESIGMYFPLFLVGAMFGPAFGAVLVRFFAALTDLIAGWGITASADTITTKFQDMLNAGEATGIAGGAPVGVVLMLLMIVGLLLVVLMLIVQLLTLYFTGVLLPLGLMWIIDPTKRQFGLAIIGIWVGVLAAHPLLFFLLSFAYLMVSSNVDAFGSGSSLEKTVQLVVSLLSLFVAGLAPLVLMKLAPVLPIGNGGGRGPQFAGPDIGARNMTDANNRYGSSMPDSGSPFGSGPSAQATSVPSYAGGGEGQPMGASHLMDAASAGSKSGAAASESASVGSSAAGAGVAAGEGAVAAEGGLAAAGAAESSTGVGAVIGVPTLIAAGAAKGYGVAKDAANTVGSHAAAPIDDHEETYGKDPFNE